MNIKYRADRYSGRTCYSCTIVCQHVIQYWATVRCWAVTNRRAGSGHFVCAHCRIRGRSHVTLYRRSRALLPFILLL